MLFEKDPHTFLYAGLIMLKSFQRAAKLPSF